LAESKCNSERLYDFLGGINSTVRRYIIPGGRHMDFYDREAYVNRSVGEISRFLGQI
jgi:fermentation-respiration switch protein FrsA (DUF1100 family)